MSFGLRKAEEADAMDIAKVQVDSWRTTYRGIVSDAYLERMNYDDRRKVWETAVTENTIFVIEDASEEIAGFAIGGPERSGSYPGYDGELYAIYLYESAQGKGGGKVLFEAVAGDLVDKGFESMVVAVLEENAACGFYERMGGTKVATETVEVGGDRLAEVIYGYPDIRAL